MEKEVSARDKIRSGIFSRQKFKTKQIKIFNQKVEIHQPSVGQLMEMEQAEDRKKALINMIINYCFVPGTKDKVFEPADEAALLGLPVEGWLSDLNTAISELSSINLEDPEKNLD